MHIWDYLAYGLGPSSSVPKGTGSNTTFRKLDRFPKGALGTVTNGQEREAESVEYFGNFRSCH
jgi:hypothetical protein